MSETKIFKLLAGVPRVSVYGSHLGGFVPFFPQHVRGKKTYTVARQKSPRKPEDVEATGLEWIKHLWNMSYSFILRTDRIFSISYIWHQISGYRWIWDIAEAQWQESYGKVLTAPWDLACISTRCRSLTRIFYLRLTLTQVGHFPDRDRSLASHLGEDVSLSALNMTLMKNNNIDEFQVWELLEHQQLSSCHYYALCFSLKKNSVCSQVIVQSSRCH